MNKKLSIRWSISIVSLLIVLFLISSIGYAQQVNFEGRTVNFAYGAVDLGERHFSEPEDMAHLAQVEKDFNVDINFAIMGTSRAFPFEEYIAPQVMSGEADVDVVIISNEEAYRNALQGFLYPLDDYMTEEYWASRPPIAVRDIHRAPHDGSFYSFRAHHMYTHYFLNNQVIIWNKSLFERKGLPDLHELWRAGEWTWDAFMDVAVRATLDRSGDGEIDLWGFGARDAVIPDYLIPAFAASNNAQPVRSANGTLEFSLDEPAMIETLELLRDLYYEEEAGTGAAVFPRFADGNLAMLLSNTWRLTGWSDEMEDDYALVPIPMGPRTNEHKVVTTHKLGFVIPIVVQEDPGDLVELTHALFRIHEDYIIEDTWEEEIELWDEPLLMSMRDMDSYEVHQWANANFGEAIGYDDYYIPGYYDAIMDILFEGSSPSVVVDAIKPAAQTHMGDLFN